MQQLQQSSDLQDCLAVSRSRKGSQAEGSARRVSSGREKTLQEELLLCFTTTENPTHLSATTAKSCECKQGTTLFVTGIISATK